MFPAGGTVPATNAILSGGGDSDEAVGGDGATVPKTGDKTPLALLCGLVLLCGGALILRRRKRRA